MTEIQRAVLDRLRDFFGVDVMPAEKLEGSDIDAWITAKEDDLFETLHAELRAQNKH